MPTLRSRLATAIGLLVVTGFFVRQAMRTPAPVPASAPAGEFSAERALRHVRAIAQRPHPVGSADHARVQSYLLAELTALGLKPQVQEGTGVGTRYQVAGHVRNVLARLPGRNPGGPAVLLMAHYDGVPAGPAASDDGAGVATLLETLRALRAQPPLEHDVIALFTDGEEDGLLGAAAFVREHPWARDAGVTLNFEARGTGGPSWMFETGPDNLDVVRVLRHVPEVNASSLSTAVYRALPNDTDLSELALLGGPALNFGYIGGVDHYHTTRDDVADLELGSLQHHGVQALALARAFGDGPLPRPHTSDAVFFTLPVVGLIVYPESWAVAFAVLGIALVIAGMVALRRGDAWWTRGVVLGVAATLVSAAASGGAATLIAGQLSRLHGMLGGDPSWSRSYAAALAFLTLALSAGLYAIGRRWASSASLHAGGLVVWAALAAFTSIKAPGYSFLFTWPLIVVAAAVLAPRARAAALWGATIIATALLVPTIFVTGSVALGLVGGGGAALGLFVALTIWLLAPHLEALWGPRAWSSAAWLGATSAILIAIGAATVRPSADHPAPSALIYAIDADSGGAWLTTPASAAPERSWARQAMGSSARVVSVSRGDGDSRRVDATPAWLAQLFNPGRAVVAVSLPRARFAGPTATVVADSVAAGVRHVTLRVRGEPGTLLMLMRAEAGAVLGAAVDGRAVDTTRYRQRTTGWSLSFAGPPDSGFTLALAMRPEAAARLDLMERIDGIPPSVATIPARPASVVPAQWGDMTVVHRSVRF